MEKLKGKKCATAFACMPINPGDPGSISAQIALAFRSLNLIPGKVRLNIPRHMVTARYLKLPSIDDEEIKKIIKIESLKHLPYTDEDVISGYRIIEKLSDGYSKVLLIIAQAGAIKNYIDILNGAGVKEIDFVSLSSEALFLWHKITGEGEDKDNLMLVNLDLSHIDIDIFEEGKLVFTRGIAYGYDSAGKADNIAGQINVSMKTYQKESSKSVNRVVLTGGNSEIAKYKSIIAGELKVPVEIVSQIKNVPVADNVKEIDDNISFAELLGVSLKPEDAGINLLPADVLERARIVGIKKNLIVTVLLMAIFAAMALGFLIKKVYDKDRCLALLDGEIKKTKPKVTAVKKMLKDVNTIRKVMARKPLAVDVVTEIYSLNPSGVYLSMLDYETDKSLTLRGIAPSLNDVLKYSAILENSAYFEGVKVKYTNKRIIENRESADFEIEALLSVLK